MAQPPPSTVIYPSTRSGFLLVPFPMGCFAGALITDIAYAATANMQWANFAAWLLAVGALLAGLAVIAELFVFLTDRRIRALWAVELHLFGNVLALALAILDCFIHSRDAYTSVVPFGLLLSALLVLILLVTGWRGWALVPLGSAP